MNSNISVILGLFSTDCCFSWRSHISFFFLMIGIMERILWILWCRDYLVLKNFCQTVTWLDSNSKFYFPMVRTGWNNSVPSAFQLLHFTGNCRVSPWISQEFGQSLYTDVGASPTVAPSFSGSVSLCSHSGSHKCHSSPDSSQ